MAADLSPPAAVRLNSCPSLRMGGLQANSGGGSRARLAAAQVRARAEACARPPVPFQKPAPRGDRRLTQHCSGALTAPGPAHLPETGGNPGRPAPWRAITPRLALVTFFCHNPSHAFSA
jgi:hypothetical protein